MTTDQKQEFFLENTIAEALFVTLPRLSGKDVNMLMNIECSLPSILLGDGQKLSHILKSAMDYGITAMLQGCIFLNVIKEARADNDDRIFVMFEMGLSGKIGEAPFDGRQMAEIIEEMEGEIFSQTEDDRQQVIRMVIPFEKSLVEDTLLQKTEASKLLGKKVLLLSEDDQMIESLGYLFYAIGIECVFVNNADEVLEKLNRHQEKGSPFHLMLCDHLSSNMDMLKIAHNYKVTSPNTIGLLMVPTFNGNYLQANDIIEVGSLEFIDRLVIPSEFIARMCYFLNEGVSTTENWNMDDWNMDDWPAMEETAEPDSAETEPVIDLDLNFDDFSMFEGLDEA